MQELKFTSDVVMEPWQELSNIEKPIVVHIRRGDYKYEDQFGLLSCDYYSRAIAEIDDLSASSYGVVWLFSDEMEIAKQILLDIGRPIRYFGAEFSTKSAFELMRLGHAFIIANSSFSYWAAALAHKFDVMVICPNPWFIGIDSSANLIPPRWHSIDRGANGY
jgi:hypothetical protein